MWDPARRTHRGRIRPEPWCDAEGTVIGQTLVLSLKPTKTDPTDTASMLSLRSICVCVFAYPLRFSLP